MVWPSFLLDRVGVGMAADAVVGFKEGDIAVAVQQVGDGQAGYAAADYGDLARGGWGADHGGGWRR